jgi:hypothetical protein
VAVDGSGNVFVADTFNSAVKEIMTQSVNFGCCFQNYLGSGAHLVILPNWCFRA